MFLFLRRKRLMEEIHAMHWKVAYSDIHELRQGAGSMVGVGNASSVIDILSIIASSFDHIIMDLVLIALCMKLSCIAIWA